MDDAEMHYLQENIHIADRLLVILQDRRLLRERYLDEDYEECRRSAQELRKIFESEMLTVRSKGFLYEALSDMQRACRTFVSAAGTDSRNFHRDHRLFVHHLTVLREVFAQRLQLIVDKFDLAVPPELQRALELPR